MVDGVGDYTYNIASEFAHHGHEAHVICRKRCEIRTDYEHLKVVPMVEAWNKATGKRIAQYVKENKIDVVSLQYVPHGFHPKGLPFGLIPCMKEVKNTGVKMMVFCHEVRISGPYISLTNYIMQKATKWIAKQIIREFKYIATSIDYYANLIHELDSDKETSVMPIVSNIPMVSMSDETIRGMRRKVANDDELIIAFFGLREVDKSIKAIEKLRFEGSKIKVLFIGKQPKDFMYNNLKDSFRTGVLRTEELSLYLKIPDILVMPENTYWGSSFKSGSLAAALQNGLPVITQKGILTSPSLINGNNILFADFSNTNDIYTKIKSLYLNNNLRLSLGKSAARLFKDMSWNKIYNEYINLLQLG